MEPVLDHDRPGMLIDEPPRGKRLIVHEIGFPLSHTYTGPAAVRLPAPRRPGSRFRATVTDS
jgi:hypothetical protein